MLILPIKKKWFDMILSGEKKEEYREIKEYYTTRFRNVWGYPAYWHEIHTVAFRNGYSHNSPLLVARVSLGMGTGKPEWGAEKGKKYYILKICDIESQKKECADCKHYGKLSLDCGRCDDDCSMFAPRESEE